MRTTSSRFLQKNIESCVALGINENALMDLVPGGHTALNNPVERFPCEILVSIFELAESISGDCAIGFRCGLNHGHVVYNDIAYTILHCTNLRESFEVSARFESLAQQFGENYLTLRETEADIMWRTYEDAPEKLRHISDLSFATLARMGLWIKAIHGLEVKKMKVRHTNEDYKDLYMRMFDCPIEYGADKNLLTFDKTFLDVPLPGSNPEVLRLLVSRLERDKKAIESPVNDDAKVAAYIEKILGTEPPTLCHVAQLMNLSERNLRRRLKTCGTSFRQVLETVRRERYQLLAKRPELSLVQISGMLGYSEQSAFSRAHKKWYGTSPANTDTAEDDVPPNTG